MTTELWYLFLTSILLAVLWIPHVVGLARHQGFLTPEGYRDRPDGSNLPAWVRRADRAHLNLVEQFGAFAGLVVVGHLSGVSTPLTVFAAAVFFWARLAHAVIHLSGFGRLMARTVMFNFAFLALIVLAVEIGRKNLG